MNKMKDSTNTLGDNDLSLSVKTPSYPSYLIFLNVKSNTRQEFKGGFYIMCNPFYVSHGLDTSRFIELLKLIVIALPRYSK